MWSTDNLNPLNFDTFEDFLKTKKRCEDVDDIFEKKLDEEEEKKEMEKLWFIWYEDESLSRKEEFLLDFQWIQWHYDKNFFDHALQNQNKIFKDGEYNKRLDGDIPFPQTRLDPTSKEYLSFWLIKLADDWLDINVAQQAKETIVKFLEVKLFGIAIRIFCSSIIIWEPADEKYAVTINRFLETTSNKFYKKSYTNKMRSLMKKLVK